MKGTKGVDRPRGKPFQKGKDPRRKPGNGTNEVLSYTIRLKNAMASGLPPEEFATIVIEEVRRHRPGSKEFFADRLMGKVPQAVGFPSPDGATENVLRLEIVHVSGTPGDGGNGGDPKGE